MVLDEKNDHYLLVETGWENRTLSIQTTSDSYVAQRLRTDMILTFS